jgi:hypothetical protein
MSKVVSMSVRKSDKPDKKLVAVFKRENGREKKTYFGAENMDDYTLTKDKEQRTRYRQRHKKDLATRDPTRAGYLSYYILWGESTSRQANIASYKKRFNLK